MSPADGAHALSEQQPAPASSDLELVWLTGRFDGAADLSEVARRLRRLAYDLDVLDASGASLVGPVREDLLVIGPARRRVRSLRMLPGESVNQPTGS